MGDLVRVDFGARKPMPEPIEIMKDFIDLLSSRPSGRHFVHPPDYSHDLALYPPDREEPPNWDEIVGALGNPAARQLWGQDLITGYQALEMLQCSGPDLIAWVHGHELFGLRTPDMWLFSRRRVKELRDLDMMRGWLTPAALSAFEEPANSG
jgi:hypothetical protein